MSSRSFSLQPFAATATQTVPFLNLEISGSLTRQTSTLTINYLLHGELSNLEIAPPSNSPTRQHELWKDTCFELFLGMQASDRYWEFNLSPAGHWNVYRFDNYRQGMQEETAFNSLPFRVQLQPSALSIALSLDLDAIIQTEQSLEVAITAVLRSRNNEVTYWALTHQGAEADFHRRDSFIFKL